MKKPSQNGFTLIESLISIIILGIILIGGMALYFNSDSFLTYANHKKVALELADDELEEIKNTPYGLIDSKPVDTITVGSFNFNREVNVSFVDDPPGGATAEDYKKVEVRVSWVEAGQTETRDVTLSTFIAP